MGTINQSELDRIVHKTVSKKNIDHAVFHVASQDGSISFSSASGMLAEGLYYIASINKMILSAITLRLIRENKLSFSDKMNRYFPADKIKGLLVYKGKDYTDKISIAHLISNTSGLPCYLIDKRPGKSKVMEELLRGMDQEWPLEKVIETVKTMKPKFRPGKKGKASYSDTNFRLMGNIIEKVLESPVEEVLSQLFKELGMPNTFVLQQGIGWDFCPFYVKEDPSRIFQYFASTKQDIVSNAQDQMIFLKAFFNGYFYPKEKLQELQQWNPIFFPFKYGVGIQKFYMPRILTPFKPVPDFIGHCGSTGSVAFYIPEKQWFITGTVNQTQNPNIAFQAMIRIINRA